MLWDSTLEIVYKVDTQSGSPIVKSVSDPTVVTSLQIVSSATIPVRLRFVETGTGVDNPLVVLQVNPAMTIILAAKILGALTASTAIFYEDSFTEGSDANGYYYEGVLNIDTSDVQAGFTTSPQLQVVVDLIIQDAANDQRTPLQSQWIILQKAYGGESSPQPGTPTYPDPSTILVDGPQTLTSAQQAQVQTNLGLVPGINFPLYLGPGNPLTGAAVTALTGGASNCLDSVNPTTLAVGTWLCFKTIGGGTQDFFVQSGTVTAGPGLVLPTNYNSVSQPKYFMEG